MFEFFSKLLDTKDFPARWNCGHWTAGHGWLHVLSDLAIFGAYAAIPAVLVYFVLRRKDIPFPPVFWLFAAFILACGTVHLIEATIFWHPWYRLSGIVKFATALISWATVVALFKITPQALALPGMARLNATLQDKVEQLKLADRELRQMHDDLDLRVQARTKELGQANDALQAEIAERKRAELTLQQGAADLERFNRMMVGREARMVELKREVNDLSKQLGRPDRYDLSIVDLERNGQ
jgi:hypothetical protein